MLIDLKKTSLRKFNIKYDAVPLFIIKNDSDSSQELNYPAIMKAIVKTGYSGFVAQEFRPTRNNPIASLEEAVYICDV